MTKLRLYSLGCLHGAGVFKTLHGFFSTMFLDGDNILPRVRLWLITNRLEADRDDRHENHVCYSAPALVTDTMYRQSCEHRVTVHCLEILCSNIFVSNDLEIDWIVVITIFTVIITKKNRLSLKKKITCVFIYYWPK